VEHKGFFSSWMTLSRGVPALIAVAFAVGACGFALATRNLEFVYYSAWMVVFIAGVAWLDRRCGLPTLVLWGLVAWTVAHLLGGTVPIPASVTEPGRPETLYNLRVQPWLPKYDQVVHCLGFGVATLTAWVGLAATYVSPPRRSFGLMLGVVLMGMGLGAMNEVIEFIATVIMPETNVGGYVNTGWDLVANLVGCTAAACVIKLREAGPTHRQAAA
jgi:hypothetical protein